MSWFGKLVGGTIGFMVGGPIGAIAGMVLGGYAEGDNQQDTLNNEERNQMVFFVCTFSMLSKIAKADGIIKQEEIDAVDNFIKNVMKLNNEQRRIAIDIFNRAKNDTNPISEYAKQFYSLFSHDNNILSTMLEMLIIVAVSDTVYHPNQENLIHQVKNIFHISDSEYQRIKKIHVRDTGKYYAILGCDKSDSIQTIKQKYKKMVTEYHPDKIISKGLPHEFITFANQKFQEIQEAYDYILKDKNH